MSASGRERTLGLRITGPTGERPGGLCADHRGRYAGFPGRGEGAIRGPPLRRLSTPPGSVVQRVALPRYHTFRRGAGRDLDRHQSIFGNYVTARFGGPNRHGFRLQRLSHGDSRPHRLVLRELRQVSDMGADQLRQSWQQGLDRRRVQTTRISRSSEDAAYRFLLEPSHADAKIHQRQQEPVHGRDRHAAFLDEHGIAHVLVPGDIVV